MADPKYRWLLEREVGGEVRTYPETTEQTICDALTARYAGLYDTVDESCVWCIGEPDRRIIEIRTFSNRTSVTYGVVSTPCPEHENMTIQALDCLLNVPSNEILSRIQAEAVFRSFFYDKSIPPPFRVVAKSYLFGPST